MYKQHATEQATEGRLNKTIAQHALTLVTPCTQNNGSVFSYPYQLASPKGPLTVDIKSASYLVNQMQHHSAGQTVVPDYLTYLTCIGL
eukprot:1134116-Pelagomonas_calceolata.AAC.4